MQMIISWLRDSQIVAHKDYCFTQKKNTSAETEVFLHISYFV